MEAKAVLEGSKCIFDAGKKEHIPLEVESNTLEVINVLTKNSENHMKMNTIEAQETRWRHYCREENTVVHCVAHSIVGFYFHSNQRASSYKKKDSFLGLYFSEWIFPLLY